jgi:hypothetical protein
MAPMFQNWCFDARKGIQPDLVLKANNNFSVSVLEDSSAVDPATNLFNVYSHRITSIKMNVKRGDLLKYLDNEPFKFSNLTTLDLDSVFIGQDDFGNNSVLFGINSLLVLAPKLENLRLADNGWAHDFEYVEEWFEFDISSVDEDSKCFTKLKTLSLKNIKTDLSKILSKCSKTLKSLDLNEFFNLENLEEELSCLDNLSIFVRSNTSTNPLRNLLSKCSKSLKTLKFIDGSECFDFSSLLEQTLKITTLELTLTTVDGLTLFINKCPFIQNFFLIGSNEEVNSLCLKDLRKLVIDCCFFKCTNSVLKQASKSSVKALHLVDFYDIKDLEFPVIPELDAIWLKDCCNFGMEEVSKLFPQNAEVL